LDLDAHCGGGTYSLVKDDARIVHVDVSVSRFDSYVPDGVSSLWLIENGAAYLPTIANSVLPRLRGPFDLCLYNAGMDPHENCATGGLSGITTEILAERERMVFEWARSTGTPIAFVLAGGYVGDKLSQSELVHLHRLTINAAAGQPAEEATCAS
jgi:acetoin utilization deacetylase AcuC-like enzyme